MRAANNANRSCFESKVKTGKVQCLATRASGPGIVLSGGVFYNYTYVKGIFPDYTPRQTGVF